MQVCVVGRGKVGRALFHALRQASIESTIVAGRFRRAPRDDASVFLLAVPDARIAEVAAALLPVLRAGQVVLHCAGARDAEELALLRARGVHVGVFHPLLSFASARAAPSLHGATFTTFGDARAVRTARKLARALKARVVELEAPPGAAYHAAAALVANGAAALAWLGSQVLAPLGFSRREAEHALGSLLASVATNVSTVGVPAALTGPVSRGDVDTVLSHLTALQRIDPVLARAYAQQQPGIVATASAQGLDPRLRRKLERALAAPTSIPRAPKTKASARRAQVTSVQVTK